MDYLHHGGNILYQLFFYKIPSASLLLNTDQLKMTFIWVIYHIQLLLACCREVTYLIATSSEVAWLFRCGHDATEYEEIKPTEGIHLQGEPFSMKFNENGLSLYYTYVARYIFNFVTY
jgi:hypothetical protein